MLFGKICATSSWSASMSIPELASLPLESKVAETVTDLSAAKD